METSTKFLLGARVAPTLVWPGRWWFCWEGHGLAPSCWDPQGVKGHQAWPEEHHGHEAAVPTLLPPRAAN